MMDAKWSVTSSIPTSATASGSFRAAATVGGSCGQPGAMGS